VRGVDLSVTMILGPITFDDKSALLRVLGSIPFALGFLAGKCARLLVSFMRTQRDAAEQRSQRPPRLAEYLIYFLPKAQREPLMGDMAEVYGVLLKAQGRRRAQFWYWFQAIMAIKPLWWNKVVKRLAKWAAITGLGQLLGRIIPWEWVRRVLPLGEWIRRIIS
jgi:hypothetical protein